MKKLFAVLLAVVLVFAMGTVALAAGETGSIEITKVNANANYEVYKMLDFAPAGEGKGVYTAVKEWEDFFKTDLAKTYFTVTEVTNPDSSTSLVVAIIDEDKEVDQALALAALEYAKEKGIGATASQTATGSTVKFDGLDLGYYAIKTTAGTMIGLRNTNTTETVEDKNIVPDIDKFVQEDSEISNADEGWGKVNDADMNQKVNYKSEITVGFGATNYVMHDTMDSTLAFIADSVKVYKPDGTLVDAAGNYEVVSPAADGHTFDVVFTDSFISSMAQGEKFTVEYSATLTPDAAVAVPNYNTVYLTYSENMETDKHQTATYTWKFDVLKFAEEGGQKVELEGAIFQLQSNTGSVIKLSTVGTTDVEIDGETVAVPTYKADPDGTVETITTDATGRFIILGLDADAYQLVEIQAPEGYNKLANPISVIIKSTYNETPGALSADYSITKDSEDIAKNTIEVLNNSGDLLPETGGIGTTIFYIVGGLLMLAAVVILVSKKRMSTFA